MPKGRRARRVKAELGGGGAADSAAGQPRPAGQRAGDTVERINALRDELREARAEAQAREQARARGGAGDEGAGGAPVALLGAPLPTLGKGSIGERPGRRPSNSRPDATRRRRLAALGGGAVVVTAGVVVGVVVSSTGGGRTRPATSPAPAKTVGPAPTALPTAPAYASAPTTALPATPTTAPPAATTAPRAATTAPPAAQGTPPPPGPPATPLPATRTVRAGESFWSVAESVLRQRLGTAPTTAQIRGYWLRLIAANAGRLPVRGDPDLIYPGTTLVLPAG